MRSVNIILFSLFSIVCIGQDTIPRFVKLTTKAQNDLKKTFDWEDEKILILNVVLLTKFSDSYSDNLIQNEVHWNDFYSELKLDNIKNSFVYSQCTNINQRIKSKMFLLEKDNLVSQVFFSRSQRPCYGVILIRNDGEFRMLHYEYSISEIQDLLKELQQ